MLVGLIQSVGVQSAYSQKPLVRAAANHIRLTTDGDPDQANAMVSSLDAAVKLWADRWQIDPRELSNFHVDAIVMNDESTFRDASMLPPELPNFQFGYALGNRIFVRSQPGRYYSRHLLLHEASHSFGFQFFGRLGPTWFMEGVAESMATHRGVGETIQTGVMPGNRDDYAYWGRFKEITNSRRSGQLPPLEKVMRYAPTLAGDVSSYTFSWAAVSMLDNYPAYRDVLQKAARFEYTSDNDFNQQFAAAIRPGWPALAARWRLWLDALDYGIDPQRHRVAIGVTDPAIGPATNLRVAADRGWQSIGYRIAAGTTLTISATGDAIVDQQPTPWISHPPGVTLRYIRDRPMGQLLAVVVPCHPKRDRTLPPLEYHAVAPEASIPIQQTSWLCLKINDATGQLANNSGGYDVVIKSSPNPAATGPTIRSPKR